VWGCIWLSQDGQAWAPPIALVTDAGTASPHLHYLHGDHLGTPLAMTSANLVQLRSSRRPTLGCAKPQNGQT
jgi:hypothetical protein